MRHIYLLLLFLLAGSSTQAQSYSYLAPTWVKSYPQPIGGTFDRDGRPTHIAQHPDGGYLTVATSQRLTITRISAQGTVLWTKNPGLRAGMVVRPDSKFTHDSQGNILISDAGSLVKLNASGDTVWTRAFPASTYANFSTKIAIGADGNYVVVHEESRPIINNGPKYIDMYALKVNAATGQTIWNTSLTNSISSYYKGYESYGLMPSLERRASGYVILVTGALVLLDENGTNPRVRSSTFYSWPETLYSSATQTTVVSFGDKLYKLNDQGDIVLTSNSLLGVDTGMFTSLAEDSENSIIAVKAVSFVSGPGGTNWRQVWIQRMSQNLQLLNTNGTGVQIWQKFNVIVAPTGEYIAAGANSSATNVSQFTLVSIPRYSVLPTRQPAASVGSLAVYPNPAAQGAITITLPTAAATGQVGFYALLGRQQGATQVVSGSAARVALPELAAGLYVVRFTGPDGLVWTNRLTVQ